MQLSKRALLARSAPSPQQQRGCVILPRTAIRARPPAARPCGDGVAARKPRLHVSAAAAQSSGAASTTNQDLIRAEVKALEAERDTAISMAESCSKTATKLAEMAMLLEALALEKVKQGDEPGARQALGEKASVLEALEKNSTKADVNYKLAAVLASRISDKQSQLLSKLRPSGSASLSSSSSSSSVSSSSSSSSSSWNAPPSTSYSTSSGGYGSGASSYSSGSGGAYSSSGNGGGSYGSAESPKWKWQQSLQEARERLKQQEAEAVREGRMARMSAEASIAAAKERIAAQAARSVKEGQDRLRAAQAMSGGSLEAAQARLKARDEEALAYVRRIMARYRAGEYVPEKDLEYAFSVLEQRFVL